MNHRISPFVVVFSGLVAVWVFPILPGRAEVVAHWRMEGTVNGPHEGGEFKGIADSAVEPGQGTKLGTAPGYAEADSLITMNEAGDELRISTEVPPATMFREGFDGGGGSLDTSWLAGMDGAVFFPQDLYGDEFSTEGWTVEMFFRTHGDQSQGGMQQLLLNREGHRNYGISINEPGPGGLRVAGATEVDTLDLADRNFADGEWYYLVASYDPLTGTLRLRVTDGAGVTFESSTDEGGPPESGPAGNLFVGRTHYDLSEESGTFEGLIDEVRISDEVVDDTNLIGVVGGDAGGSAR